MQANLREQLAVATRCIQWSYSIFCELEWGEGYYNGDIKTRKTMQDMEMSSNEMGHQRSQQLRELYESLSETTRPCSALSLQDLSETEWYYLVCMSFVYNIGQGLPGRCLADGKPIWICNANQADSRVFCRSLLAKSASIQVQEDIQLIQYVQASLLGNHDSLTSSRIDTSITSEAENGSEFCSTQHLIEDGYDLHYHSVLSSLFKSNHHLTLKPPINFRKQSCFRSWKNDGTITIGVHHKAKNQSPQKMLKKILFETPRMHNFSSIHKDNILELQLDGGTISFPPRMHNFSSIHKDNILELQLDGGTISFPPRVHNFSSVNKELEKRVEVLNVNQENVTVSLINKNVLIDIRCQWKDRLLLDILHSLTNLALDPHSFEASTIHGILHLVVQSKMKESMGLSAGIIRQLLQKAITKCG